MRRALVTVFVVLVGLVVAAPPVESAPTRTKFVYGFLTGSGTTPITQPGCPYRIYSSSGTYRAKHLGRGTYLLNGCIPQQSLSQFVGTLDLATRRGDELHAVGTGEGLDRPLHHVPFVITSGTGRFADATGTLFLDFFFLNETNCVPGDPICQSFDELIVVSGTIAPK
jgi:hypothetical protein